MSSRTTGSTSAQPPDITIKEMYTFFGLIIQMGHDQRHSLKDYTSQQDFGTRKVYCVSNITFHAASKYAIKIFPSPTVFVQWPF